MKAIRVSDFGGPDVLKLENVADPKPDSGQVLIRVKAAGVNPVDTYIRSGAYARKPNLPYTPGTDAAGLVEAAGPGVKQFKPGDHVYTNATITGACAELALCEESRVHRLPAKISFAQGAALGVPYSTAYRALFQRGAARPGEVLLVHGASGGVGVACVQFAGALGMTIIGTAGGDKNPAPGSAPSAPEVADHPNGGYEKQIMNNTLGNGGNLLSGKLGYIQLAKDLGMLAQGGRVVVIGNRGTIEINPRDAMAREAGMLGLILWAATDAELAEIHSAIVAGV